jgi:prevent-host-death family protein
MQTIGAFDAKTHFSSLLERVEHGETFLITRHGKVLARLIPVEADDKATKALAALEKIKSLREKTQVTSLEEWKEYREEGRP